MAENNDEPQWSENLDSFLDDIKPTINEKYGIDIKDLLKNPAFYVSKKGIDTNVANIREEMENHMKEVMESLAEEKKSFEKNGVKCDAITKQLSQNISMQAKQNNIPIAKLETIDRNTDSEETIYIKDVDNGIIALVAKLAQSSNFIADFSTVYKTYSLGSWLFDGQKNYLLNVILDQNLYVDFDMTMEELNTIMDRLEEYIKQGSTNA